MKFEKSADTKILEAVLSEAKVGDKLTYEALSKALGRDVRKHAIGALRSARWFVLREKQIVFAVEDNVGLIRLDDKQIVTTSEADRSRMSKIAKRSLTKLAVVKFAELDEETKRKHVTYSAQMGALAMFATKHSTNKIETKVQKDSQTIPIGETLKLFTD